MQYQHYPQPTKMRISEPVEVVNQSCERCGAERLHRYRVVDYRGWLRVTKCRSCLAVASRESIESPLLTGG